MSKKTWDLMNKQGDTWGMISWILLVQRENIICEEPQIVT